MSGAIAPVFAPSFAPSPALTALGRWKYGLEGSGPTTTPTVPISGFGSIAAVGSGVRWAQPTGPSITRAAMKTAGAPINRLSRMSEPQNFTGRLPDRRVDIGTVCRQAKVVKGLNSANLKTESYRALLPEGKRFPLTGEIVTTT